MNLRLQEYYRRHFDRFCVEQLKISTPNPGELIPLTFNDSQRMLLEKIEKQRKALGYIRYCCCKSRQSTMSTFAQALCFHAAVTTRQFNSLLIANDDTTTADIFGIASRFVTHLSSEMRPMTRLSNKTEVMFENPDKRKRPENPGLGSKLVFQSASKITAGTGSTRHACHLSEISKWNEDSVELLFSSILPAIHLKPGTIVIKESTPYVGGTDFREMCENARAGDGDDLWHFIPWFADTKNAVPLDKGEKIILTPEEKRIAKLAKRGQPTDQVPPVEMVVEQFKWRRKKIKELKSEIMFSQEYPCIAQGQRVGTQRGIIPIEEVRPGDQTQYGVVTAARCTGMQPIFRVVTHDAYSVTATADHPLIGSSGPLPVSESHGKLVHLGRPRFADSYYESVWWEGCLRMSVLIDEDFGRFLGYFMGDGSLHSVNTRNGTVGTGVISIACDRQDTDVVADVERLFQKIIGPPSTAIVGMKRGGVDVHKGSSVFIRIAQGLGIYKGPAKPHRKVCVPECIWRSPQSVVREFLSGLFEADACKRKGRAILLFSKHRQFLEDVQVLLLGFGIQCRVATNGRRNKLGPYVANELTLNAVATAAFGEKIGFIGQRKRSRFTHDEDVKKLGRPVKPMNMIDVVEKVVDLHESVPVYDLTVAESHQFDANGIRVHNCTFEEGWIKLDATVFDHGLLAATRGNLRPPRRFVEIAPGPRLLTVHTESGLRDCRRDLNYCAIWQEPEAGVQFDVGADIAVGSNEANDWSVAQVLRRDTREQVAEIHVHMDPKDFGTLLYWLGLYYNTAQLIVEMNGPGFATHGQLASMAYPYIYIWRHRERDVPTFSNYRGWKTQQDSKQLMLSNTVHRFNHKELIIHSRVLWDEMHDYVQIAPGQFRASIGNDDAVVALMIAVQGGEDETFGDDAQQAQKQSLDNRPVSRRDPALHDDADLGARPYDHMRDFFDELRGV